MTTENEDSDEDIFCLIAVSARNGRFRSVNPSYNTFDFRRTPHHHKLFDPVGKSCGRPTGKSGSKVNYALFNYNNTAYGALQQKSWLAHKPRVEALHP